MAVEGTPIRARWDEDYIKKRCRAGHGTGEGAEYVPWLTINDVPSRGRVHRVRWRSTDRIIHFLSDLEYHNYLDVNWTLPAVDERENYPLDRDLTRQIARDLGVRHPRYPRTGVEVVMTTDLLLTYSNAGTTRYVAISVKSADDLSNERVNEKLAIERLYWQQQGHEWRLRTTAELSGVKFVNLNWLQNYTVSPVVPLPLIYAALKNAPGLRAGQVLAGLDGKIGVSPGGSLASLRCYVAQKNICVPLDQIFIPDLCTDLFTSGKL